MKKKTRRPIQTPASSAPKPVVDVQQIVQQQVVHGDVHNHFHASSESAGSGPQQSEFPRPPAHPLASLASPPLSQSTEPSTNDVEITAYVLKIDLVQSEVLVGALREANPPGSGDGSPKIREWLQSVWAAAGKKAALEPDLWSRHQDHGDGVCLAAGSAESAHLFAQACHDACLEGSRDAADSVRWKFRIGVAKGAVRLFTDVSGRPGFSSDAAIMAARLQAVAKPGGTMICPETWRDLPSQYQSHYDDEALELPHPKPTPGLQKVKGHGWPRGFAGRGKVIAELEAMLSQKAAKPFLVIFENTGLGSWNGSVFRVAPEVAGGSAEFVRILENIRKTLERGSKVQKDDRDDFLKSVGWIVTLGLDRSWIEQQLEAQFNGLPMALPATGGKGVEPHPNHPGVVIDVPTFVSSALAGAPVPVAKVAKAGNAPYVRTTAPQVARGPEEGDKRFEALLTVLKMVLPHVDVAPKTGEQTEEYLGRIEGEIEAARRHAEKLHRDGQPVLVTGNHLHDFIRVIQAKFSDRLYITRYLDRNFHCVLKDHFGVVTELIRILELLDNRNNRPSKSKP